MLKTFRQALQIEEIRKKLGFTFLMLIVVRLGSQLPTPGVNPDFIKSFFASQTGEAFNFFNAFTGGSFEQMSIFALSISPYITSSIVVQMLQMVIPKLNEWNEQGDAGKQKVNRVTRYVTVAIAMIQALVIIFSLGAKPENILGDSLIQYKNVYWLIYLYMAVVVTAGSAFVMWLADLITRHGIGNGSSMIISAGIISSLPTMFTTLYFKYLEGSVITTGNFFLFVLVVLLYIAMIIGVVFFEGSVRKIPVQYANRQAGQKGSDIPVKLNSASVIPVIFASSLMSFPGIIMMLIGKSNIEGVGGHILNALSQQNWCSLKQPWYSVGLLIYILLVVFFAYFYTSITFNPLEIANNMKRQGGFVPGLRPGKPTSDFLAKILNYIIFIGAIGLIIVAVIPIFFNGVFGASVSFGGTSLIIVVGVVLETIKQVEAQLVNRHYKGFLND